VQHGWLVNFIHRLTWPRVQRRLDAEFAERMAAEEAPPLLISVPRVIPSYREVDQPRFSHSVDEHITRFQELTRLPRHQLQQLRVVFKLRVDRGDNFQTTLYVDGGVPRVVVRELVPDRSLLGFEAAPFSVAESVYVDGMTVTDKEGRTAPRGIGYWKGGTQRMNDGDTLYASFEMNATDDGHGLVWGRIVRAGEAENTSQAA
jgi:hypothetical protein